VIEIAAREHRRDAGEPRAGLADAIAEAACLRELAARALRELAEIAEVEVRLRDQRWV
jgi:hypothetical protein